MNAAPVAAAVPPTVPIVADAASLVVVIVSLPEVSSVASRLFADSLAFRSLSDFTWPVVEPKVMLVAVPPPVAPIVSVRPERPPEEAEPFAVADAPAA